MIVELGHFALILALPLALIAGERAALGRARAARRPDGARATGGAGAVRADRARLRGADARLRHLGFLGRSTSSRTATSTKPLLYKITGVWGNHEGSMLLWVLILTLFGAAVARFGDNLPPDACARACSRCRR